MTSTNTYEIDDDFLVESLKKDARERNARYSTHGLEAFLPPSRSGRPGAASSNNNARKPNLRFLNNIIQDTNAHNAALKLRELEHAGDRLRALRGDPPRDRTRPRRREQRGFDGGDDGTGSNDDADSDRGSFTGESLSATRRRHSPDEARRRRRRSLIPEDERRGSRRDKERRRRHSEEPREGEIRRWRDRDESYDQRQHRRQKQRRRRHDDGSSDSDRSRSRNEHRELDRHTKYEPRRYDSRQRAGESRGQESRRKHLLDTGDDYNSAASSSKRRRREREGQQDLSRSRNPLQREHEDGYPRNRRSRSRSRIATERSRRHHRQERERADSRCHSGTHEVRSNGKAHPHSRGHRRSRSPQVSSSRPVETTQGTEQASEITTTRTEEPAASSRSVSRSATRSPSIGPPPPGDPKLLGAKYSQQPVQRRGRGAHSSTFASSAMDRHFDESYDPRADVRQPQLASSLETKQGDDWADSLDAVRARSEWKATQKQRLLAAGFSEKEVGRWETRGVERMKDEEDVKWNKKGQGREWDRGKVIMVDGSVETEVAWMDAISET